MKEIKLTQGKVALVDDEDFEFLNQWKWCFHIGYATRNAVLKDGGKRKTIRIHRVVLNCPDDLQVDHINHDTLDNRKENLRLCTVKQNSGNQRGHSKSSSGYRGVSWIVQHEKWAAQLVENHNHHFLGYYDDKEEAARAFDKASKLYYGEFAFLNFPNG